MNMGDAVTVDAGPWAGNTGIVEELKSGGRLRVLLDDTGQHVVVREDQVSA